MCGRYTLTDVDGHRMSQRYDFDERGIDPATLGRFNVCPTESVLAVTEPEPRRRAPLTVRWGLVPRSAQAVGKGSQPINVRSETAAGNRWFGSLMAQGGRCLLHHRGDGSRLRQIGLHHEVAVSRQLGANLLRGLARVAVVNGDPIAPRREGDGGGPPDPA